ncbi:hypothetical protein [Novosphingobium sp. KN65.2]|uniref:hypothetical protein n=1 Tax=Novosphingobium sp. KN65.2 TaxID=1478134 RepID=UPI0005E30C60|nr:hypothetical protein [Novosphingobium sp. KN65.2]CDO34315.1 hypothetical protein SPHV1_1450007 [Novosphingobium sp. KN65.2]
MAYDIQDGTCESYATIGVGAVLVEQIQSIERQIQRDVEHLAKRVAFSAGACTERGILHTIYCNGAIKQQGEMARPIIAASLSHSDQVTAFERAAHETLAIIAANKPKGRDLLIWRSCPSASRTLMPDGLHVRIYTRLSWDKIEEL